MAAVCAAILQAGCWGQGISGGAPEVFLDGAGLNALVGANKSAVASRLGSPFQIIGDGPREYLIYRARSAGVAVGFMVYVPVIVLPQENVALHCLLFEIDDSETVTRFETGTLAPGFGQSTYRGTCPDVFWTPEQYQSMQKADRLSRSSGLRALARDGDIEAAVKLAARYGETQYLAALVDEQAPQMGSEKVYELFLNLETTHRDGTERAAWRLLCTAADLGMPEAQIRVAYWHREEDWTPPLGPEHEWARAAGIRPDNRVAYMWYALAATGGSQEAVWYKAALSRRMSESEISRGEALGSGWTPGNCPNPLA